LNNGYDLFAVSSAVTVALPAPPEPASVSLTPNASTAEPGQAVTVTVTGAPGGAGDWLALAQVGSAATSYLNYVYVGAGVSDRTWTVNMPTTAGDYEFRLYVNNGYTALAVSSAVVVAPAAPEPPPESEAATLTPSATTAAPGAAVTVTVAGAPGGATDWLALARVGSAATSYLSYIYVGAGVSDRTWTVNMSSQPGIYEFRLFANNGYTQIAVSPPVTVQ
jgi:hypothetical protein